MSSGFQELAQKLDELREQELELEARGIEAEELEAARRDIREQQKQVEEEIEVLEEQEAQQAQLEGEGIVQTPVVLTSLQQSLQRVYGSAFSQLSMPELCQHLQILNPRDPEQVEYGGNLITRSPDQNSPIPPDPSLTDSTTTPSVQAPGPNHPPSPSCPDGRSTNTQAKSRAYLSDDDKVILMNLCVHYQSEHVRHKKTDFWSLISEMFQQTTGTALKQPQRTVRMLVAQRKATLRVQERESGTVQREDELSQKIDQWILHEDAMKEAAAQAARTPAAEEREREEAAVQRRFLLARRGMKRSREETDGEQSEAEEDFSTSNGEMAVVTTQRRKKRNSSLSEELPVVDIRAAMSDMGRELSSGLLTAVRELVTARLAPAQGGMEEKFQELRTEIERDREAAERHRDLMETQRSEDLARAEKQRAEDLSSHRELMEMQRREDRLRMETERAEDKAAHDARNEDLLARLFGKLEELKK